MIYILAILWFVSGFFGAVYSCTVDWHEDFKFPSVEFLLACIMGIVAPAGWFVLFVGLCSNPKCQITLFKARNK